MASRRPDWHPILAAHEVQTGVWEMRGADRVYGEIRLQRAADPPYYWAQFIDRSGAYEDLRRWRKLAAACVAVHQRYIYTHGPKGPQNGTGGHALV